MPRFATDTKVSSEDSLMEIKRILERYDADSFSYHQARDRAGVGFTIGGRQVRFLIPLPLENDPLFDKTPGGRERPETARASARQQAIKQRWRALALAIKANLEAVECGIITLDEAFLANIALPNGQTVGEYVRPAVQQAYTLGTVPQFLALPEGDTSIPSSIVTP